MKKSILTIIIGVIFLSMIFVGCAEKPNENKPEQGIKYSDIYKNDPQKSEIVSGIATYKASYGYVLTMKQGYNNFYYQSQSGGRFSDLNAQGEYWGDDEVKIEGALMRSGHDRFAVRKFAVPISGNVHIYGNPHLVSDKIGRIRILLNDEAIADSEVKSDVGIYHSNYADVKAGDSIYFILQQESDIYWNPTIDYIKGKETNLHSAVDGYYGDVHPYYNMRDGKMYMYYLSTGRQSGEVKETFSSLLTVSDNLIHYNDVELKMDAKNPPEQELYYALGIYEDKDGNFRSSYGKGNYAGGSVSKDLITWSNGAKPYVDSEDGLLKYTYRAYFDRDVNSGRDPDIYYDKSVDKHYMVVMNYYTAETDKGEKGLALYIADGDGKFSQSAVRLLDCTNIGDPECPQLKKVGNRWYLFYSIYGTGTAGGVGNLRYRIGDEGAEPQNVNWNGKPEYSLDGGDLHASQLTQVGDKLYMYGWIGYSPHANVWGGYLNLAREVYQKENGTLGARCDEYLTRLLNKGEIAKFSDDNTDLSRMTCSNGAFTGNGEQSYARIDQSFNRNMLFADIKLPKTSNYAGFCVEQDSLKYYISLVRNNSKLYLAVTRDISNPLSGVYVNITDVDLTDFKLKVIVENNFIEAFVNDEIALTANTLLSGKDYNLSIISGGADVSFTNVSVCKLSDSYNIFD